MQTTYPHAAGHKVSGPSQDAAEEISPTIGRGHRLVLEQLEGAELTADEIAHRTGKTAFYVRPRISEMHTMGMIEKTDQRRTNSSGLSATVWRLK